MQEKVQSQPIKYNEIIISLYYRSLWFILGTCYHRSYTIFNPSQDGYSSCTLWLKHIPERTNLSMALPHESYGVGGDWPLRASMWDDTQAVPLLNVHVQSIPVNFTEQGMSGIFSTPSIPRPPAPNTMESWFIMALTKTNLIQSNTLLIIRCTRQRIPFHCY